MKILSRKETEEIEERIQDVYGTEDCLKEFVVLITGKEDKIWLASRKIFELNLEALRIDSIGLYFGRVDCGRLRLSVEGAGIVGPKAKKNIGQMDRSIATGSRRNPYVHIGTYVPSSKNFYSFSNKSARRKK